MDMYRVRLGKQGRLVIPQTMRDSLHWQTGADLYLFANRQTGTVQLCEVNDELLVRAALASLPADQRRAIEKRLNEAEAGR